MATVGFQLDQPARGSGGKFPKTIEKPILVGYAEAEGALLAYDGTNFVACGADPAQIAGVALTPGGADTSGFIILGRKEYPPNTMQAILPKDQEFKVPFLGVLPATSGDNFGVTRDADGVWKIDFNKPDKPTFTYLGNPSLSPSDAAGAGQNVLVRVQILDGSVQVV